MDGDDPGQMIPPDILTALSTYSRPELEIGLKFFEQGQFANLQLLHRTRRTNPRIMQLFSPERQSRRGQLRANAFPYHFSYS